MIRIVGFVSVWQLRAIRGACLAALVLDYNSFVQLLVNLENKRRSE